MVPTLLRATAAPKLPLKSFWRSDDRTDAEHVIGADQLAVTRLQPFNGRPHPQHWI
jgi:hypothetical protein